MPTESFFEVSGNSPQSDEEDEGKAEPTPEAVLPEDWFLVKVDGFLQLGQIPESGTVRRADLARALCFYVTE